MKKPFTENRKIDRKYVTIMGVRIDSAPKEELLKSISNLLSKKIQFDIVTPNPEIILEAQSNPKLAHSLNSATFSIPDGIGLKLAHQNLKITKGREMMLDLFKLANDNNLKIYLLGSTPEVIRKSLGKIEKDFPNIKAKGNSGFQLDNNADPVSEVDINMQSDIVKEINLFQPDLLFVAFGAPKQEIWISGNLSKLKVTGAMTVGGALDYYSGFIKPVPVLLEQLNLEWLWRLIQEPKRIKRIFKATIIFPIKVILSGNQSKHQA